MRRRRTVLAAATLALAAAVALYGVLVEPARLRIERITANLGKGPPVRLALLSDLHLPAWRLSQDRILAALERERPDILLIAGDLRNHRGGYADGEAFLERAAARWRTLMVMGDADQCGARGQCISCRLRYGEPREFRARILRNEAISLPEHNLVIAGLDDPTTGMDVPESLPPPTPRARNLLLLHSSHKLSAAAVAGYDLVLAGNTHGGQVLPMRPFLAAYDSTLDARFPGGTFRLGDALLFSTRGIGTSLLPVRLGVPPEIMMIDVL